MRNHDRNNGGKKGQQERQCEKYQPDENCPLAANFVGEHAGWHGKDDEGDVSSAEHETAVGGNFFDFTYRMRVKLL